MHGPGHSTENRQDHGNASRHLDIPRHGKYQADAVAEGLLDDPRFAQHKIAVWFGPNLSNQSIVQLEIRSALSRLKDRHIEARLVIDAGHSCRDIKPPMNVAFLAGS